MQDRKSPIAQAKGGVPAIYRNEWFGTVLWAMVAIQRHVNPNMNPIDAIRNFCDYFGLGEDDAPMGSLQQSYYRRHNKYIEMMRAEGGQLVFHRIDEQDAYVEGVKEKLLKNIDKLKDPRVPDSAKVAMIKEISKP